METYRCNPTFINPKLWHCFPNLKDDKYEFFLARYFLIVLHITKIKHYGKSIVYYCCYTRNSVAYWLFRFTCWRWLDPHPISYCHNCHITPDNKGRKALLKFSSYQGLLGILDIYLYSNACAKKTF